MNRNADLFATAFLKPCEDIREKIGVLMFEFSRFWSSDYEFGREFVADLDSFLGQIAEGMAVRYRDAKQGLASLDMVLRTFSIRGMRCRRLVNRWHCLAVAQTRNWLQPDSC
jgi:hypothetical protein